MKLYHYNHISFFILQFGVGELSGQAPWLKYYRDALDELSDLGEEGCAGDEPSAERELWSRPSADSDKLYMSVGGGDVIEVGHPLPSKISEQEDPRYIIIIITEYK
jgi:hypothetical protein